MLLKTYGSMILALHTSFGKPDQAARYARLADALGELRDAFASIAHARETDAAARPVPR